ncbi:MAG: cysteine--tRNA ligase [Lachnospiraceae bacterium]|nr:cysteine--tRNA ligase [Lachnospiraceae bacterium]MBP3610960.1 cysteine--tRNA ligase [Lachnospiraceae bacterium]
MENKVYLFNTLTRKVENLIPNVDGKINMYTCGPTVYHFAHIGNLRCYIMEDILEKTLRYVGYDVKRVMNITDVGHLSSDADTGEDKMLKGAKRENKTVMEIAQFYTDAFFADCQKLNIKRPDVVEPATNCIDNFIEMVEKLLEKGYAYVAGDNVYFDTSKLKDYYVFSSQSEQELMVGVREDVSEDSNKRNKSDFVLWFTKSKFDNQELKWNSPWGVGYPGWHIECSCISMKHLGEYMDIHCGGIDNIFPHHTNEIAQSEAYLGHKWCNYWFHVHHLTEKGNQKMSKSNGEFLTVSLLEQKGYKPIVYRFFCLQSHYRKPLEFSYEVLENVGVAYEKLHKKVLELKDDGAVDEAKFAEYRTKFEEVLSNDMNTSMAITMIYDVLRDEMNDATKKALVASFDEVLSLDLTVAEEAAAVDAELEAFVLAKIEERKAAKKEKDFAKADAIRAELLEKGVQIKDTREGTVWELV